MTHSQLGLDLGAAHNELGNACRAASYSKVISICDNILKFFPADSYAQHCKTVSLIHQTKFDDCLQFIRKQQKNEYHLEKAYCEYRLNRLSDALKTILECPVLTQELIELRAQIYYRLEEFEKVCGEYEHLMQTLSDDYQEERFTNLIASKAALSCFKKKFLTLNYSPALFETAFNAACYYIGKKDYVKALKHLNEAETLCMESLVVNGDLTEDQINEEIAPIRAQKGFIMQQQLEQNAAAEVYHTILRQRSGDPSLMAVISNNLICINKDQNIFDTRKRIKASSADDLSCRLFQSQRSSILANQALFYLNNNQIDVCDAKLKLALIEDPKNVRSVMISAVSLAKGKQLSAAIKLLEKFAQSPAFKEADRNACLNVILLLVHLQLMAVSGTLPGAIATAPLRAGKLTTEIATALSERTLAKLLPREILVLPLIASLRVAFLLGSRIVETECLDESNVKRAKEIVTETLEFWSKKSSSEIDSDRLLSCCIDFFRSHGFAEEAAHLLEQRLEVLKTVESTGSDSQKQQREHQRQSLLALLIQAYSKFDHTKASQTSRNLEFKEKLSEKEVDSLESTFLFNLKGIKKTVRPATAPTPKSQGKSLDSGGTVSAATKHKKKKRRVRLPKNYEPGVPPDPERWLPRRERTGFRGKRRDKRQPAHLQRGAQGVTSSAAPELDMGNTGSPATSTPPKPVASVTNNNQRRPQPNKPLKNKKGKKR